MYHQCRSHHSNDMTRCFTLLLTQLAHLNHHGQMIHLMMQYVCTTTDITLHNRVYTEASELLSQIVRAHTAGGILALVEVIDCNKMRLEVCRDVLPWSCPTGLTAVSQFLQGEIGIHNYDTDDEEINETEIPELID